MSSSSKQPPCESLDGLKFGQKIYFEDGSLVSQAKPFGGSKKGRGGGGGSVQTAAQPPRCQVEGCRVDLSDAKAYYSRHKVCGFHSKSPTVIVAGLEQRFCQQCSRFHQLPEFDQGKRSCRRRLAGHNERRRKPQPSSSLTSRFARFSSPNFENNDRSGGFLMEFSPYPKLSLRNAMSTPGSSDPSQTASLPWQVNSETHSDFFLQGGSSFHDPPPRHPPPVVETYTTGVTDSSCALSLLSSQTWGSSRNIAPPSVELNNNHNMVNFNGTPPMTLLPASSSHVAAIHQVPNPSWGSNGVVVPDLGLGQISQPIHHSHVPVELQVSQQGRRPFYMDMGQSRAYESPHWSL